MTVKYHTIAVHRGAHYEEYLAISLLKKFGEEKFPGISTARIAYWDAGAKTPDGRPADEYEKEGTLPVGVGGGRLDEHPPVNGERKKGKCSATLVAETLGVSDDPALRMLLSYALFTDLGKPRDKKCIKPEEHHHPLEPAAVVKLLHQRKPNDPEKVMEWAMLSIEAMYYEQNQFWNVTKKEFGRIAQIEEVQGPNGNMLKMVTVVSDDEQMNNFARSVYGCRAAIVIQKKSSGNVQIFTSDRYGLTLYDVACMLRIEERRAKGKIVMRDWRKLRSEGVIEGVPEWHFQYAGQRLLNGSLTAHNVPPTKIPLERIMEIVRIGISPSAFDSVFESSCKGGWCRSSGKSECNLYKYGLQRCRHIRYEMKKVG